MIADHLSKKIGWVVFLSMFIGALVTFYILRVDLPFGPSADDAIMDLTIFLFGFMFVFGVPFIFLVWYIDSRINPMLALAEKPLVAGETIRHWMARSYATSKKKGWYKGKQRTFGDIIALMHSELSEALEDFRIDGDVKSIKTPEGRIYPDMPSKIIEAGMPMPKPVGVPIELADVCIRVFDTCAHYEIDLPRALELKSMYNITRPHRHGGKVM